MSRLHTAMTSAAEIAERFGVADPKPVAMPTEVIEGNRRVVVLEKEGRRLLNTMSWGFTRLARDMRLRSDPPGRIGRLICFRCSAR